LKAEVKQKEKMKCQERLTAEGFEPFIGKHCETSPERICGIIAE